LGAAAEPEPLADLTKAMLMMMVTAQFEVVMMIAMALLSNKVANYCLIKMGLKGKCSLCLQNRHLQ
jgi:hypothetical protein